MNSIPAAALILPERRPSNVGLLDFEWIEVIGAPLTPLYLVFSWNSLAMH
jgi:hypothetical protein